jgi:hypothetical protein
MVKDLSSSPSTEKKYVYIIYIFFIYRYYWILENLYLMFSKLSTSTIKGHFQSTSIFS